MAFMKGVWRFLVGIKDGLALLFLLVAIVIALLGSYLGGVHFELTGEDVTECTGGARGLVDADLAKDYRSQVDPRLNYGQALELAMRIATVARSA